MLTLWEYFAYIMSIIMISCVNMRGLFTVKNIFVNCIGLFKKKRYILGQFSHIFITYLMKLAYIQWRTVSRPICIETYPPRCDEKNWILWLGSDWLCRLRSTTNLQQNPDYESRVHLPPFHKIKIQFSL